jgi:hypothetical protein
MAKRKSGRDSLPIITAPMRPFRLVVRDASDKWECTWEQANRREYDYLKLSRLSVFLDVGLKSPYLLAIAYDGTLILPAIPELLNRSTVAEVFNGILGKLLLGGIFVEAVSPEHVAKGLLYPTGYFTDIEHPSPEVRFHAAMRTRFLGTLEVPFLINPPEVTRSEVYNALRVGGNIAKKLPKLSLSILLRGITDLINHEWAQSLISIWNCIEQLISQIWEMKIIVDSKVPHLSGRKAFLEDHRSWPVSNQIELLFQKKFIDFESYKQLSVTRKVRNEFIHKSINPTQKQVETAANALYRLMSRVFSDFRRSAPFPGLAKVYKSHSKLQSEVWGNRQRVGKPEAWLEIPPIPGALGWGDESFETFEDISFNLSDL